ERVYIHGSCGSQPRGQIPLPLTSSSLIRHKLIRYEAKQIGESMILKYTVEDVEMVEDKDIKDQINEYHKLLEELKT
ncbi:hypothetical protein CR513_19395, partial [Mucuna pruriens]